MLNPSITRRWNGIYVLGQEFGVELHPRADGTLSAQIIAAPEITGIDRACCLFEGAVECIPVVHDTRLDCFAADQLLPFCRRGFSIVLEPGMAPALHKYLPALIKIAATSHACAGAIHQHLVDRREPIYHMIETATNIVARIVLNRWATDHSIRFERENGTWRAEADFMNSFDNQIVRAHLQAAETWANHYKLASFS